VAVGTVAAGLAYGEDLALPTHLQKEESDLEAIQGPWELQEETQYRPAGVLRKIREVGN